MSNVFLRAKTWLHFLQQYAVLAFPFKGFGVFANVSETSHKAASVCDGAIGGPGTEKPCLIFCTFARLSSEAPGTVPVTLCVSASFFKDSKNETRETRLPWRGEIMLTWREDFEQMSGKFSATAKIYCVPKFYDFVGNQSSTLYSPSRLYSLEKLCCWNLSTRCCLKICGHVGRCHVDFGEKKLDLEHHHAGGYAGPNAVGPNQGGVTVLDSMSMHEGPCEDCKGAWKDKVGPNQGVVGPLGGVAVLESVVGP